LKPAPLRGFLDSGPTGFESAATRRVGPGGARGSVRSRCAKRRPAPSRPAAGASASEAQPEGLTWREPRWPYQVETRAPARVSRFRAHGVRIGRDIGAVVTAAAWLSGPEDGGRPILGRNLPADRRRCRGKGS